MHGSIIHAVTASDDAAVRAAFDGFGTALDRGDLEAALDWCTDDFVFIGSGDGEEAVGKAAVPAMFEALSPHLDGLQFSLTWDSIEIDVLGEVAVVLASGNARLVTTHRDETFRYRLTGLLVRNGERWLWRLHHGSEPGAW